MAIPLTLDSLQKGLLNKDFTAVSLVDEYLERIEKHDDKINAFITESSEEAYSTAKKVDLLVQQEGKDAFKQKPLLGACVAHKDLFLTKGVRTTAGSKVLESYIPEYSATVVKRLKKAGSIMIGKLNCDAWAHGASGENSDFGPTKNPWNTKYVAGGSSSGSAAAVASNFSLYTTGTDTGGSVRQPANFCGMVGFKPTYGVVPRYGVVAMASSLDSVGHITRTTSDARKIFSVTKGQDGFDATVAKGKSKSHDKIKIGIPEEYFVDGLDKEVEKAVIEASKVFKKDNFEIVEINLPHTKYAISVYYIIQPAEVSSNLARYDGIRYGKDRASFGQEAKRRIMLGTYVLSAGYYDAYYLKAMKVRSKIIEDFEKAFKEVDVILAPVSPTPAFELGAKDNDPLQMYLADILTVAANLAGIPGLALPFGKTKNNLPLGFQLLGPRFSEELLFDLGEEFEKLTSYKPRVAI
jgi:aspartyl-tRNA(Asn)/glutamyl-tRNA(Gln) amidotransferase subunit A